MTDLLEKAFSEASKLPVTIQNLIAERLLEDIRAEAKWDEAFAETQDELSQLADDALADFRKGEPDLSKKCCEIPRKREILESIRRPSWICPAESP